MDETRRPLGAIMQPIRTRSLAEEIIEQIAVLVRDGHIAVGERFPSERDLQARWQVSRPVLREAFRVLEMRGVIESRPGGGRFLRSARVIDPSRIRMSQLAENRDILLRIWEAREAVETKIAALAAERATAEDVEAIGRPLAAIGTEPPERLRELDLNGEFHAAIARAARNPLLEEMIERLLRMSAQVGFKEIVGMEDWATLQGEHQPIYEAIRDGDPEGARVAMVRHFDNLRSRVEAASRVPAARASDVARRA